jgi:ubiquitin-protein ligase
MTALSVSRSKRINKEFYGLKEQSGDEKIMFVVDEPQDLVNIYGYIFGPDNTPYADHKFRIHIELHDKYPFAPPRVTFIGKIIHPNIHDKSICVDILNTNNWNPSHTLKSILISIYTLLREPNFDSPLDSDLMKIYHSAKGNEYHEHVKKYCETNCEKK